MMTSQFFVTMLTLSSVGCVQMHWGVNPDLVKESINIQGREHIKRLVVLVGDIIDLECQLLEASLPLNAIRWTIDGKPQQSENFHMETNKDGDVFAEDHLIFIITEKMGASTVSCEYSKGRYADRVGAELHVHTLEIEARKEVCELGEGDIRMIFKETKGSSSTRGSANVPGRIKAKISNITNVRSEDIRVNETEYSLYLPIARVKNNETILAMKPKYTMDGIVSDSLCGSAGANSGTFIVISIVIAVVAVTN